MYASIVLLESIALLESTSMFLLVVPWSTGS